MRRPLTARSANRRSAPRTILEHPIHLGAPGWTRTHRGIALDVSFKGMFIATTQRPKVGSDVAVGLHVSPTDTELLLVKGRVVRADARGIAITLDRVSDYDALAELIDQNRAVGMVGDNGQPHRRRPARLRGSALRVPTPIEEIG